MYKEGLALNNLQWLICHKTQPNQTLYTRTETGIIKLLILLCKQLCLMFMYIAMKIHWTLCIFIRWSAS